MSPISIALIILAVTVILFIWEPVPIIVTAIGASIAFAYTGLIDSLHDALPISAGRHDGHRLLPVPCRYY